MKNIEMFDRFAGYIFSELYENFPVCIEINLKNLLHKLEMEGKQEELILSETLFWLRDSGFLTFTNPTEKKQITFETVMPFPQFSCVVLTAKGLEILKKTPKRVQEKGASIGTEIGIAIKDGFKSKISELVGNVLSYAF